jgi:hypothetical protein
MIAHGIRTSAFYPLSRYPLFLDHSQYSLATLILVFLVSFFRLVSSEILSLRSHSQTFLLDGPPILVVLVYCCYNVWFPTHSLQLIIILDSPSILIFLRPIYFSSYSTLPCLMGYFICSVIAQVPQPHSTMGLIIAVYDFSCVCFDKYLDFTIF